MTNIRVPLRDLEKLVHAALTNLGVAENEAKVVTFVLMYAEKRGSSQGLIKLKERTVLPDDDCKPIKNTSRTQAITTIDGGGHTGMFVLYQAVEAARAAVKNCGIALVTTHNTRSSTGSIGCYARMLADDGYIAMVLAGSPKVMAIEGGIDPVLGTNPIAIGIPTSSNSIIFDSATAAITWFSVINARDRQLPLPSNVAIDHSGAPTDNPLSAMQGALRTIAGAKGSGLALMFEFLTASLAGTSIVGDGEDNRGNTIICIDPHQLLDDGQFYRNTNTLVQRIRSSRPVSGQTSIRLPGEASDARAVRCEEDNSIEIDEALFNEIETLAKD